MTRTIKLVDEFRNRRYVLQYGQMDRTKHQRVLSALEKRALCFHDRGGFNKAYSTTVDNIDETGTVDTEGLTKSDSDGDSVSVGVSNQLHNDERSVEQWELDEI